MIDNGDQQTARPCGLMASLPNATHKYSAGSSLAHTVGEAGKGRLELEKVAIRTSNDESTAAVPQARQQTARASHRALLLSSCRAAKLPWPMRKRIAAETGDQIAIGHTSVNVHSIA